MAEYGWVDIFLLVGGDGWRYILGGLDWVLLMDGDGGVEWKVSGIFWMDRGG